MTHAKHKLRDVRTLTDLKNWWETVVDVRVKAIVLTAVMVLITIVGFQYQVNALTNDRLDSICEVRVETATRLNHTLKEMVDLSDLFPNDPLAEQYTATRLATIDRNYPIITKEDCE